MKNSVFKISVNYIHFGTAFLRKWKTDSLHLKRTHAFFDQPNYKAKKQGKCLQYETYHFFNPI